MTRYAHKPAEQILADLVASTPGEEGKWFAAARELGLYDARDHVVEQPAFALGAGPHGSRLARSGLRLRDHQR